MLLALAVGVPVSGVFLWLAVRDADLGTVRTTLGDAKAAPLGLAVAAIAVVYAAQAERWRRIAHVRAVSRARFAEMVVAGVACNNVLPARVGDLLRARWLGRAGALPGGRALATVVLDRACDVVVLFTILVGVLPEVAGSGWSRRLTLAALGLVVGLAVLFVFARVYIRTHPRARLASRSLPRRVLRDVIEGIAEPMGRRRLAAAVVLSVVAWLAFAAAAVLVGRSVGVHLGVVDALLATAVINLGVAIPSSPGFVGTYQWLGVASLGLAGIGHSSALAFAILLQATWYVPTTVIGGVVLAIGGLKAALVPELKKSGSESAS
jgi:glycosyltransferase 2 family protein